MQSPLLPHQGQAAAANLGHSSQLEFLSLAKSPPAPSATSRTSALSVSASTPSLALSPSISPLALSSAISISNDTPTDTLLPGQNFSVAQMLRAASRNSVSSYYSLHVEDRLLLRWENNIVCWTSGSPSQSILRAILSSDETLQLLDQRSKVVWSVFGEDHNDSDVKLRFLRLDVDGNLRLYSWHDVSRLWRPVWQAVENQCNVFATCGLCGICIFNASGSSVCRCPFSSTMESNLECLVPYGQDCMSSSFMTTYFSGDSSEFLLVLVTSFG